MKKKSLILYTYYVSGVDSSLLFIFDAKEEEYQEKLVRFNCTTEKNTWFMQYVVSN